MSLPTFTGDYLLLTTKPNKRRLSTEDPEYVYVCPFADMTGGSLYAKATYSDDSTYVHAVSLGTLYVGKTLCVGIGYDAIDYAASIPSGETLLKIEVYVGTASTEDDGDKVTYIPYTPSSQVKTRVYYVTSYGGLDSLICVGDRQTTVNGQHQLASTRLRHDGVLQDAAQFSIVNSRGRRTIDIHTGNLPPKEEKALRELGIKKPVTVYQTLNGTPTLLPCVTEGDGIGLASKRATLHRQVIRLSHAWEETVFDRV